MDTTTDDPTAVTTIEQGEALYFDLNDRCCELDDKLAATRRPAGRVSLIREIASHHEDQAVVYRLVEPEQAVAIEVQADHNDSVRLLWHVANAEDARATGHREPLTTRSGALAWPELEYIAGERLDEIARTKKARHLPAQYKALIDTIVGSTLLAGDGVEVLVPFTVGRTMRRVVRLGQKGSVLALAATLVTGCGYLDAATDTGTTTPIATTSVDTTGDGGSGWQDALDQLATLTVKPEDSGAHYDRDDWPHWRTKDGCDTRERVLQAQGVNLTDEGHGAITVDPDTCEVDAGGGNTWTSLFDDEQSCPGAGGQWDAPGERAGCTFTDPADLEIDHLVPLEEMARSHTRDWSRDLRTHYANDLDGLWAVSAETHGHKGSAGPEEWLPPAEQSHCYYAYTWVRTKARYSDISGSPVTVDQVEHDALESILTTCTKGAGA